VTPPAVRVSPARPEIVTREPRRPRPAWVSLATATDHKQVGLLYVATALSFLVLAACELVLMRVQLVVPDNTMIDYVTFDRLLSAYGATAIVLFALPLAIGIATYVVPLQIGARGVALPRLGALSFWLYALGGITLYASFLYTPSEAGVNPLPPLSDDAFLETGGVDGWIAGVGLALIGLVLAAINLVTTIHRMRAPGMVWRRLPLFSSASTVVSYLLLLAGPVFLAALTMLFYDRHFSGVFFDPGGGGAPILFQHLSWIFFTSAYVAIVVFAAGAISEIVPTLSRKPSFSHRATAASLAAIGAIGFLTWMQNMYTADIGRAFAYFAMVCAVLLLIPFGVLFFNWIATMWRGTLELRAPLLFALGAISTMSIGLAGELGNSVLPVGWQLADTATAWQDTHYALIGAAVFGGFAARYYWFPKMTGRTMGEGLARASFWTLLVGVHATLLPMALAGLVGQPVDISEYFEGTGLATYNLISTIGSLVLAIGILLTLANAARSVRHGTRVGHDPWLGDTLEWFALSPPPEHGFDAVPDVRSTEPLREIRALIAQRTEGSQPAPGVGTDPAEPVETGRGAATGGVEAGEAPRGEGER
jgi:heme/copper-type cytochrome/quinol oxidase subunit 1